MELETLIGQERMVSRQDLDSHARLPIDSILLNKRHAGIKQLKGISWQCCL